MHEFSICQNLVSAALAELKKYSSSRRHSDEKNGKNGCQARLKKIRIVVGRQHAVVPDNLRFAYEVLTRDTPAEGSILAIRVVPVTGRCRKCGWHGKIQEARYLCADCESGDLELTGGNELYMESLEVETDEPSHD